MTPHTQDQLYDPTRTNHRGNCWQTVIASVLDLPPGEVPHFVQDEVDHGMDFAWHWMARTIDWLNERGLRLDPCYGLDDYPGDYLLVSGKSPRAGGTIAHVVIYRDGVMVHDPHPDRTGLATIDYVAYTIRTREPVLGLPVTPTLGWLDSTYNDHTLGTWCRTKMAGGDGVATERGYGSTARPGEVTAFTEAVAVPKSALDELRASQWAKNLAALPPDRRASIYAGESTLAILAFLAAIDNASTR